MANPQLWGLSTSPLTISFWGWEEAETLNGVISGIPRIVHVAAQAWKVVAASVAPRAVQWVFIPKVVNTPFIPRVLVQGDALRKVTVSTNTGKGVKETIVARVQANESPASKISQGIRIGKVIIDRPAPKVCVSGFVAKIGL